MPIGFEVAFPSLLEIARGKNIDVPYDAPVLKDIYAKKELKLTRFVCWDKNMHTIQYSILLIHFKILFYINIYIRNMYISIYLYIYGFSILHLKPRKRVIR